MKGKWRRNVKRREKEEKKRRGNKGAKMGKEGAKLQIVMRTRSSSNRDSPALSMRSCVANTVSISANSIRNPSIFTWGNDAYIERSERWTREVWEMNGWWMRDEWEMNERWMGDEWEMNERWVRDEREMNERWMRDEWEMSERWMREEWEMNEWWMGDEWEMNEWWMRDVRDFYKLLPRLFRFLGAGLWAGYE